VDDVRDEWTRLCEPFEQPRFIKEIDRRQDPTSVNARPAASQRSSASSNGRSSGNGGRGAIARIAVPAVSGAVGIAGGILLGRNALQRNRKVLGIPVPSKVDLSGVSQHIGEASRQFGKLAGEVRTAAGEVRSVREKAEQIGKVLG
jgi:hypothetical protein